ncbi:MAG: acyl-CoA thioesterase [Endomicrobia bacterium]|nr:acyl-CoA thioesterase [Endomicrobiia bacterium]
MKIEVEVPIKVRYSETDQMGVVYHANYIIYFNVARDELMKKLGIEIKEGESLGYLFPVYEVSCKYLFPARYPDELLVKASADILNIAKLEINYRIINKKTNNVLAIGKTINVLTTKDGKLLIRLPEKIKELCLNNPKESK